MFIINFRGMIII